MQFLQEKLPIAKNKMASSSNETKRKKKTKEKVGNVKN